MLVELTTVVAVNQDLQRTGEGQWAPGKATRASYQTSQVVAQFGIDAFYRKGVGLAIGDSVFSWKVDEAGIQRKVVAPVVLGLGGFVDQVLKLILGSVPQDPPGDNATCFPLYGCDDVDALFLVSMKVKSSSNSRV